MKKMLCRLTAAAASAVLFAAALPAAPAVPAQAASTLTVGKNGTFKTIGEAVNAAAQMNPTSESARVTIAIEPGTYREQLRINTPYLTFTNSNPNAGEVLVTWYYGIGYKYYSADSSGYYNAASAASKSAKNAASRWGTSVQLRSGAKYFRAENITFENSFNRYMTNEEVADGVEATGETLTVQRKAGLDVTAKSATERAAAMCVEADFCEFYECSFLSSQDTLYTANPAYFKECRIQGNTDYIFGSGDVVFDACELCFGGYSDKAVGGYITAARQQTLGYLFWECTVTANPGKQAASGYFGRPWRDTAHVLFYNTRLQNENIITAAGWTSMSGVDPAQATFREYNTKTISGGNVNTGSRVRGTVLSSCSATREQYFGSWTPYYYKHSGSTVKIGEKLDSSCAYYIRNAGSGLYLTANAATGDVSQEAKSDANYWYLEPCADGYYILYADLGGERWYGLEAVGAKPDNGTNIGCSSGSTNDGQLVKFVKGSDGAYEIVTRISDDRSCAGVSGGSKDPGTTVIEWECNGEPDQRWFLEEKALPLTGRYIRELYVLDREHAKNWALYDRTYSGMLMFGDRDVTVSALPDALKDSEIIMTACDSKYYDDALAECIPAQPVTLYAAMDDRVSPLPAWLSDWTKTDVEFDNSGSVHFVCYARDAEAGETVSLGMNGQSANCVNYVVFAAPRTVETTTAAVTETTTAFTETTTTQTVTETTSAGQEILPPLLKGDADLSGSVDVSDVVLIARYCAEDGDAVISAVGKQNADCNQNGQPDMDDAAAILKAVAKLIEL